MRFPHCFAALAVLIGASPLYAHRLLVDPKVEGDQLRVEVYYDDDTPAQDAKVTVRRGDTLIAEGRTDEKGVWTCPKPAPGSYAIRAESTGHVAKKTLVIPDPSCATRAVTATSEGRQQPGIGHADAVATTRPRSRVDRRGRAYDTGASPVVDAETVRRMREQSDSRFSGVLANRELQFIRYRNSSVSSDLADASG